jgi:hypothetical protein
MNRKKEIDDLDCNGYELVNKLINRNFFFLNAHGEELNTPLEIPVGVRVIMFCHEKELEVCQKFDRFNWENILLNPSTSDNYCNFLNSISKYSSIRDHFCIYEEGDVIRNLRILTDEHFRDGLFRLPVKGYAYDSENEQLVVSDGILMSEVKSDDKLMKMMKKMKRIHIKVDSKRVSELLSIQSEVGIISSYVKKINNKTTLSNLIGTLKMNVPEFTILLMVCRDRAVYDLNPDVDIPNIAKGLVVREEISRVNRRLNLERLMR